MNLSPVWSLPLQRPSSCWSLRQRKTPPSRVVFLSQLTPSNNSSSSSSNHSTTEQLRGLLDQLHTEAKQTSIKTNNARMRLMRLSEAAEKLRRQAAVEVQAGKENEARELLLQKRKVMQALEKSKRRIELLDKLSAMLNEAISVKETQLVGNVALDLQVSREDASHPIRIISPKEDVIEDSKEAKVFESGGTKFGEDQELEFQEEYQSNAPVDYQQEDTEGALSMGTWNKNEKISSLKSISSYENFLKRLDLQFHEIEAELLMILRLTALGTESNQKQNNLNLQQTLELLEDVHHIRSRVANIILTTTDSR
ncbi:uncharacterized protein LOC131245653 [Magnolia sinica]|uniref:uncharacterized protein LOC131245653 n=1 Tax=Magnolia sinica TaxID=86752 RepID=UPI00265944E5|nr:uncharacterized protein LOC131245653 [Magnolia sinica]XP_058101231.1 uncharacterized protein LOC131245653 [Magnolia sinica]XP_058101232.1 uncharacterized protein LOC131245653 [Magnolia sinica]XP_058101233.1 uncharacterized protein LOC131245653 [Magnolia sinica]